MENNNQRQDNRFQILRLLTGYRRTDRLGNQQESGQSSQNNNNLSDENELISLILNRERRQQEHQEQQEQQELSALERRIRRRRNNLNNIRLINEEESDDELLLVNNLDYDYRTYPLPINWKDIYSYENDSCKINFTLDEIMQDLGYLGCFFYNEIIKNFPNFKTLPENFVINILAFYKEFETDKKLSNKNNDRCILQEKFIKIFEEKIDILSYLVQCHMVTLKELYLIKILIDLLLHYFSINKQDIHYSSLIKFVEIFYNKISDQDLRQIKIMISNNKAINEALDEINATISDRKHDYIKKLYILRKENTNLFSGLDTSKFVI